MTLELAQELYIAREKLSKEGRPETGTYVPVKSWNHARVFCPMQNLESVKVKKNNEHMCKTS